MITSFANASNNPLTKMKEEQEDDDDGMKLTRTEKEGERGKEVRVKG